MNTPKNMMFLIILLCGAAFFTGCSKENETATVQSGTLSVIRTEEDTGEKKGSLIKIDPFERLDAAFTGTAPDASAGIKYLKSADYPMNYHFEIEPKDNLRNGDVIRMYITDVNAEQIANDNGYTLTATEKEFIVDGVDYYVETLDQITEELQNEMNERAGSFISENVEKSMTGVNLESYEFIGNYLLNKKTDIYNTQNHCFCVYKVNTSFPNGTLSYYYCTDYRFVEIRHGRDNNFVGGGTYNSFYIGEYRFIGYKTLDELYEDCITQSLLENYSLESDVKK